ncbi:MAG: FtsH protease activity modulator HflK [Alphaproteobacteria bacterium]|nr:FtsH protease activity modulator HflK [Alphaproteobacteria bacterium]
MPWNQQGGGGPWGQGPRGPQPPNLEDLLRRGQDRFRGILPGGGGSKRMLVLIVLVLAVVWIGSGFYRVGTDEQGVVLRFGKWVETTMPGLNYHLPTPIETVETPKVTRVNRVDIGFRGAVESGRGSGARDVAEESLMLTGDENIVDVDFTVFWIIRDAGQYLFNIAQPDANVKMVAESAMREVIGKTLFQRAVTEGRSEIQTDVRTLAQQILDSYKAGIQITEVKLQKVDPPNAVIDAFRDVQRARADLERQKNEAESYANDIIPRARGESEQMLQDALAYKQETELRADGDARRFLAVYTQYLRAKEVTQRRIYIETMEKVLRSSQKVLVDPSPGGSGVVPYLPLPELQRKKESK